MQDSFHAILVMESLLLKAAGSDTELLFLNLERRLYLLIGEAWIDSAELAIDAGLAGLTGDEPATEADVKTIMRRITAALEGWERDVAIDIKAVIEEAHREGKQQIIERATGKLDKLEPLPAPTMTPEMLVSKAGPKKPKFQIDPSFSLEDKKAIARLAQNQVHWIGRYADRTLSIRINDIVSSTMLRQGMGRKAAGQELRNRLEREFGTKVPAGWTGGPGGYFKMIAANTVVTARAQGALREMHEIGVTRYTITNPMDERTCDRCEHLDGKTFEVRHAIAKMDELLKAKSPDEVKRIHPWARNKADIERNPGKYTFPPFHGDCRCVVDIADDTEIEYLPNPEDEPDRGTHNDFTKVGDSQFHGMHGAGFSSDGDIIEGHSVRVVKVMGTDGKVYYEASFKVTAPYGDKLDKHPGIQDARWKYLRRDSTGEILKDSTLDSHSVTSKALRARGDGYTFEVGKQGAVRNAVRIRAQSTEALNRAMDDIAKTVGGDLRMRPDRAAIELQTKARLAAKMDPATFGSRMMNAKTEAEQIAIINEVYNTQSEKHPWLKDVLADVEEREVYPGHRTLYSQTLGKKMAESVNFLYHDGSPSPKVIADIATNTGLMSSASRFDRGIFTSGMSTAEDFDTGGADNVFTRLAGPDMAERLAKKTGGRFRAILNTEEVMGRLDWYAFDHDAYGRAGYGNYGRRSSIGAIRATMPNSVQIPSNELMAQKGIPPSAIEKMIIYGETNKREIIAELQSRGINDIRGIPLDKFFVVGDQR